MRYTIQGDIRRDLNIQPKDVAAQQIERGHLIVEFIRPVAPQTRSLAGILGPPARTPPELLEMDIAVGGAIAEEWQEYLAKEADTTATKPQRR